MKQVYLILAAMLLLCLAPMPYGYFMIVRLVSMMAFGFMAYRYYRMQKIPAACLFVFLALLFQPIYKIALGRVIWNIVDVLVALFLVLLFVMERRRDAKDKVQYQMLQEEKRWQSMDNRLEFDLRGVLGTRELMYVASEENQELTDYLKAHPEVLDEWGKLIGYKVLFPPTLLKKLLSEQVVLYRAPYMTAEELKGLEYSFSGNDFLLKFLDNPADKKKNYQGFVRTEDIHWGGDGGLKVTNRYYPLSACSRETLSDQLRRIGEQISEEEEQFRKGLPEKPQGSMGGGWVRNPDDRADANFCSQENGETTDDLLEEVRGRIAQLRQRGVSERLLEQLVHPEERISRLVITKDYSLLLSDYNDMEIKMEPLVKAIYLLFLNHPEGIMFKCLPDYREELMRIYIQLKPAGMNDRTLRSIEDVTNPLLNSINEKCARIRGAFVGQFDNHLAKYYYIDGKRGEAKKIALPRDLVVWE